MSPIRILISPATDQSSIVQLEIGEILRIGRSQMEPAPGEKIARLTFPEVSGKHAEIHCRQNGVVLIDLNSTNGTRINREYCSPGVEYVLHHLDEIQIAGYPLRIDAPELQRGEVVDLANNTETNQFQRQLGLKAMPVIELADFDENYVTVGSTENEVEGVDPGLGVETVYVEPLFLDEPDSSSSESK